MLIGKEHLFNPSPIPPSRLGDLRPPASSLQVSGTNNRLAYTMQETADILGVSYITVHRLIKRGLLKSSSALRHKLIPKSEIERFLKQTN